MEWRRGPAIGQGSSATVFLATAISSGDSFAVKSTEFSSSTFLQKEQNFLSNLNSPYVVKSLGFDVRNENSKPMFNLFMEYVSGGTLWDEIQRKGGKIEEETIIGAYAKQILHGLDYLHTNGLVHCDIKSRNILLGDNNLKIADLGCARFIEIVAGNNGGVSVFSGSPAFMSPEVARGEEQGFEADVWAFGCTVIEMVTGNHPWPEITDPVSVLYRIGFSNESPEIPNWLSEKAKDFVTKCFIKDLKERWTVKELLNHPFILDLDSDSDPQKGILNRTNSSPNCVLDQGFWDSMEDSETLLILTHQSSWFNNRIQRLARNSSSELPNWDLDQEDWITVRSNNIKNDLIMVDESLSLENSVIVSDFREEEVVENSEFDYEFLFLSLDNDFSSMNSRLEEDFDLGIVKFEGLLNEHSFLLLQIDFLFSANLLFLPFLFCFVFLIQILFCFDIWINEDFKLQ